MIASNATSISRFQSHWLGSRVPEHLGRGAVRRREDRQGTCRLKMVVKDAKGTVLDTCDTGPASWTACD